MIKPPAPPPQVRSSEIRGSIEPLIWRSPILSPAVKQELEDDRKFGGIVSESAHSHRVINPETNREIAVSEMARHEIPIL